MLFTLEDTDISIEYLDKATVYDGNRILAIVPCMDEAVKIVEALVRYCENCGKYRPVKEMYNKETCLECFTVGEY